MADERYPPQLLADPTKFATFTQRHAGRALPVAQSLGIDPALVTCDATNIGSRRVIESRGGVFEDQRKEKLRFWLPTKLFP